MDPNLVNALRGYLTQTAPEMILGVMACVLFLGSTWRKDRHLWAVAAVASLVAAGIALYYTAAPQYGNREAALTALYSPPRWALTSSPSSSAIAIALCGGLVFVFFSWDEAGDEDASEYLACLLLITAGVGLTGAANDLITLFLALELVSIPTYLMLYLPRADAPAQEAAMKYFLAEHFLVGPAVAFGFSYLYGMTGTTNLAAMADALRTNNSALTGLGLVALIMIVAGLGFRITAVPFHFYAPDVYQGTSTGMAALLLAFVPKLAGFTAAFDPRPRLYPSERPTVVAGRKVFQLVGTADSGWLAGRTGVGAAMWIMAAVTMSLGNTAGCAPR